MSNWKELKLGEVADFIDYRGKTPKKSSSGVPLITARIVKNGAIRTPTEFIPYEDYSKWMIRGFPQVGDVVMTTEAPLGEVAQIKDASMALGQRIITIQGHKGVLDNGYLKYFLQSSKGQSRLKEKETGTTVTGIKSSELKTISIYAPDYPSQRAISEVLASIDDKIEINIQINQNIEKLARALFKQWFIDFEFPNKHGLPYKSNGGKMIDSELGLIPEGWNVTRLGEIISIKHGYAFRGEFFSDIETSDILITPGNFKIGGGFNGNKYKYYKGDYPEDYILQFEDLIVTMTDLSKEGDTLGYSALTPIVNNKRLLHNQRIGKIIYKKSPIIKFYLYWVLRSPNYRSFVLSGASGTTVKHTSPSRICEYKAVIPADNILSDFDRCLSELNKLENSNNIESNQLLDLRDVILPKIMSGELEVSESLNEKVM